MHQTLPEARFRSATVERFRLFPVEPRARKSWTRRFSWPEPTKRLCPLGIPESKYENFRSFKISDVTSAIKCGYPIGYTYQGPSYFQQDL